MKTLACLLLALGVVHSQEVFSDEDQEILERYGSVFDPAGSDSNSKIYELCARYFNRTFKIPSDIDTYRQRYDEYLKKFGKLSYSSEEKECRLRIYADNLIRMENRKRKYPGAELGENKFTDWTQEEKKGLLSDVPLDVKSIRPLSSPVMLDVPQDYRAPSSVNWVTAGKVRPIKDQGNCGSCWAFTATAVVESAYMIKNNVNVSLSEQQLVDCDRGNSEFQQQGCNGGNVYIAMDYIRQKGLSSDSNYPYAGYQTGQCRTIYDKKVFINGPQYFSTTDVQQLKNWIALRGPISIAIRPIPRAFMELRSWYGYNVKSVFDPKDCKTDVINGGHAMAVVGYGTERGVDYWLVKNSWGTSWGDNGYVKFIRGKNACGIETDAFAPVIN